MCPGKSALVSQLIYHTQLPESLSGPEVLRGPWGREPGAIPAPPKAPPQLCPKLLLLAYLRPGSPDPLMLALTEATGM